MSAQPEASPHRRGLVLLHGFEDATTTLAPLRAALDPADDAVAALPTGPAATDAGPAWFVDDGDGLDPTQIGSAIAVVHGAVRSLIDGHGLAPGHVTLAGFSQGAALALAAAFHADAPGPLGELVLVAPFLLPPDVTAYRFESSPLRGVRIVHGSDDDAVPIPMGKSAAKLLERRGIAVIFVAVDGAGHDLATLAAHVPRS